MKTPVRIIVGALLAFGLCTQVSAISMQLGEANPRNNGDGTLAKLVTEMIGEWNAANDPDLPSLDGLVMSQKEVASGGSTFSYSVWPDHPFYEEVTRFLGDFRTRGSELRQKIAEYNGAHQAPDGEAMRVLTYAGQAVIGLENLGEESHE